MLEFVSLSNLSFAVLRFNPFDITLLSNTPFILFLILFLIPISILPIYLSIKSDLKKALNIDESVRRVIIRKTINYGFSTGVIVFSGFTISMLLTSAVIHADYIFMNIIASISTPPLLVYFTYFIIKEKELGTGAKTKAPKFFHVIREILILFCSIFMFSTVLFITVGLQQTPTLRQLLKFGFIIASTASFGFSVFRLFQMLIKKNEA